MDIFVDWINANFEEAKQVLVQRKTDRLIQIVLECFESPKASHIGRDDRHIWKLQDFVNVLKKELSKNKNISAIIIR